MAFSGLGNFHSLPTAVLPSSSSTHRAFGSQQLRASTSQASTATQQRISPRRNRVVCTAIRRKAPAATHVAEPEQLVQLGTDLQLPETFNEHFILGKHLGSGAYGTVRLAIERRTGRDVAVKIMPKIRGTLSKEKTLQKLKNEINLLSRVQHCSNVVSLLGVYECPQFVYIVTEVCEGGDLETLLRTHGRLTERQAALVIFEILKVIVACHSSSMVHGDVKPANFLIKSKVTSRNSLERQSSKGFWIKAVDFGCSQSVSGHYLTRRTGTPVYMAPEVYKRQYAFAADLWSLGMLLYQLVANRLPFWDDMETCRQQSFEQVMKAVFADEIPYSYGPWMGMSQEGLNFVQGLLHRDPEQRLTAADAMQHQWFRTQFGQVSTESSNNIVAFPGGGSTACANANCSVCASLSISS